MTKKQRKMKKRFAFYDKFDRKASRIERSIRCQVFGIRDFWVYFDMKECEWKNEQIGRAFVAWNNMTFADKRLRKAREFRKRKAKLTPPLPF